MDISGLFPPDLDPSAAQACAAAFTRLGDPIRVRLLHTVASGAAVSVDELADRLGLARSDCADHVRALAGTGLVLHAAGDLVAANPAGSIGLPHAADVLLGLLPRTPLRSEALSTDVAVRALADPDWPAVRRIYAEGIATGNATFETETPSRHTLEGTWLPGHRWVAEIDGEVVGWTAISPISARACYAGVGETSVYVAASARGRGVGKSLLYQQVTAADAGGLWTLQTSVFPQNRISIALHHSAGYRTLAVRERIAQHHGVWRDTVQMERRAPAASSTTARTDEVP